MRRRALLLLLPLLLAACGGQNEKGGTGCTADVSTTPNAAYKGAFSAFYTPTTGASGALTFNVTVRDTGAVSGTVTDGAGVVTSVTGTATDRRSGCDDTKAAVLLTFTPEGGTAMSLAADKTRDGSLLGSFGAVLAQGALRVNSGSLTVSTPPLPG